MTLEGEYYVKFSLLMDASFTSRNPHDIGRRILLDTTLSDEVVFGSQSS